MCVCIFIIISFLSFHFSRSYDEDEEYESNIDILESQIDDCVNEW